MQQKYRTGKQLGLWVSDEVADRLSALAERTKLPQSQLLREALELLFEKYERQRKEKKRGSQPA
ncbi:MAG TPA: ribbon-helix-helix domain-containing protein [Steroidobacteraceae bacterium]|nr:ribbon-helix-helix domain-containing protein [Steroidobacteraceae bacterium]